MSSPSPVAGRLVAFQAAHKYQLLAHAPANPPMPLRAVRVQLEPIFLLYEAEQPFAVPGRSPDLELEDTRLWRLEDDGVARAFGPSSKVSAMRRPRAGPRHTHAGVNRCGSQP